MTIKEKQDKLSNLATVIELYRGRFLSRDQKERLEAYEYGMKFDLKKLIETFRHQELDTKIHYMEKTIRLVKGQHDEDDQDKAAETRD